MLNRVFQSCRNRRIVFGAFLAVSFVVRSLLAVFPKAAAIYGDELMYLELAQNIWLRGSLTVYALPARFTKLLYPLLLSPFYAISDPGARLSAISVFNAFLVASSLIPGYLLAKRFLKSDLSRCLALLALALSPNFGFSMTFMAENLYIPLFLWAVWLLIRVLDRPEKRIFHSLLLGMVTFLLYMTKEAGSAFFAAGMIVFICRIIRKADRKSFLFSFGAYLAGTFAPLLLCTFTLFRGSGFSYSSQFSLSNLSSSEALSFTLYSAGAMILYFLVSGLFTPILIPFAGIRRMDRTQKHLMIFAGLYVLFIALGTAYAVSLPEDFGSGNLRIHLRYFLPALYPFLLLFLSAFEKQNTLEEAHPSDQPFSLRQKIKDPMIVLAVVSFVLVLLLPRSLSFGSLVDAPSIYGITLLPDGGFWLRIFCAAVCCIALCIWIFGRGKAFLLLEIIMLVMLELVHGASFVRDARMNESIPDTTSVEEIRALDRFLDQLDGNVLVIRDDIYLPNERMMDSWTNDNYYVATGPSLTLLGYRSDQPGCIDLGKTVLPTPVKTFLTPEKTDSFHYLAVSSTSLSLSEQYNMDITPDNIHHWRIYRTVEPSKLHLVDSAAYHIGDPLTFYGDSPTYLQYLVSGFAAPEPAFTWNNGTDVSVTLNPDWTVPRDLTAEIVLVSTMGPQPVQIFANGRLLYENVLNGWSHITFEVPAEVFSEPSRYGAVTFNIMIPESLYPDNGDPRRLGLAFESFVLNDIE